MTIRPDICVIGAGSGGLVVAAGAAMMGARVVLIERGLLGGDCLNYGCVPSKALIAAAEAAVAGERAVPFGVSYGPAQVDFGAVMDHVRAVIDSIAPNDSEERFRGMGVDVVRGHAVFRNPREVEVDGRVVAARRFVIATGSSPAVPPIPGLETTPFLTNETIFENRVRPDHLVVIGGGPIGLELAQAHRRLGAEVTVVEALQPIGREDSELAAVVLDSLRSDGVRFVTGSGVASVSGDASRVQVKLEGDAGTLDASHLLVATGRRPNIDLALENAGVAVERGAIKVDARLRTTNRRIYAVGDVTGGPQFTHVASYHAGIALRNILFRLPAHVSYAAIPRVTYTDPEIASVGLTEAEARDAGTDISVLRWPLAENDRAQAQRETGGLIKIVCSSRGRVLGTQIVGHAAGELIAPWVAAVARREKIGKMAALVAAYPTLSEIGKRAAGSYFTAALGSPKTKAIVRLLARLG